MKVDTSKLVDALSKVVDLAHREASARADAERLNAAIIENQAEVDAIAEQLIAASGGSTAAVNGIVAVAAALTTPVEQPVPVLPVVEEPAPVLTQDDSVQANIDRMKALMADPLASLK